MPNTESAKRGHRKAERRRIANKNQRSTLRTLVKKVRVSAAAGNKAEAEAAAAAFEPTADASVVWSSLTAVCRIEAACRGPTVASIRKTQRLVS